MRRRHASPSPVAFDPIRVAGAEYAAWVAYYRRDWPRVLAAAVNAVRFGFGMGWLPTLHGAWLVLRANQAWAPYPDNDPQAARALMTAFYALVARKQELDIDPAKAAEFEVDWWHEHRILQRERTEADESALVGSLTRLYAYVYARPAEAVREAASLRARAMRTSDDWVADGCRPDDPRLIEERADLELSYFSLLRAVEPAGR